MNDTEAEGVPHTGWLDNWLASVAGADDMRLRANAAVALATMGGRLRMAQFVELVGETAVKLREGKPGASDVLAIAVRETEREGFDHEALAAVLDAPDLKADVRKAARALLAPGDPATTWWRLRRIAVRPRWTKSLGLALQYSFGAAVALSAAMWLLIDRTPLLPMVTKNVGYLLAAEGVAVAIALACARLATPGLRTRVALVLDGLFCGLAAALPAAILVMAMMADANGDDPSAKMLAPWLMIAVGVFEIAALRLAIGLVPASVGRLRATFVAVGWPLFVLTAAALGITWLLAGDEAATKSSLDDQLALVSWIWIGGVLFAPAFVAQVRATDEIRPAEAPPLLPFTLPPAVPLVGGVMVLIFAVQLSARTPITEFNVGGPGGLPGPFAISASERFRLRLADEKSVEVAFDGKASDLVLRHHGTDIKPISFDSPNVDAARPPSSDDSLAKPSFTPIGRHFLVKSEEAKSLCLETEKQVRCGVPTLEPGAWLRILTGRTRTLVDGPELHFLVVPQGAAPTLPVSVPKASLDGLIAKPGGVFTFEQQPTPDRPVLEMAAPGALVMTVTPVPSNTPADTIRDRVVIAQLVDSKIYQVWSADDPDPPVLRMRLAEGQSYLICMRMVTATFLDCTHQTRGLLTEQLQLSFALNPPPQVVDPKAAKGGSGASRSPVANGRDATP
jgi:hypothetical protein